MAHLNYSTVDVNMRDTLQVEAIAKLEAFNIKGEKEPLGEWGLANEDDTDEEH